MRIQFGHVIMLWYKSVRVNNNNNNSDDDDDDDDNNNNNNNNRHYQTNIMQQIYYKQLQVANADYINIWWDNEPHYINVSNIRKRRVHKEIM